MRNVADPYKALQRRFFQCCGSGSAFIWLSPIRIGIGNADPDAGAWKLTKINKLTWVPAFPKNFFFLAGLFLTSCLL